MDKKIRFELRLNSEERIKLSALSAQSKLSESEVLRTFISHGTVIEVDKNQKIELILNDLSHAFTSMVEAVTTRLEGIEEVVIEALSNSDNFGGKTRTLNSDVELNNLNILPTLEEFEKEFKAPLMPSQIANFNEMVKQEYFKKFGVLPT